MFEVGYLTCAAFIFYTNLGEKMADSLHAVVDQDTCIGCGACAGGCPAEAITVDSHAEVDPSKCVGCGACTSTCPVEAIKLEE